MGTSDLAKDLHASHTRERLPMLPSLGLCLLAARAHGLAIVDGVHLALDDEAGLEFACRQGLELGFDGKTLIHPKQIAAPNRIFAPSAEDLAQAEKIIAAHRAAEQAGRGVVVVDGRLVENLHVENARRLLDLAAAIRALEGASA
jgi:citrate lyase subunit beta/citryl-CoA lyase